MYIPNLRLQNKKNRYALYGEFLISCVPTSMAQPLYSIQDAITDVENKCVNVLIILIQCKIIAYLRKMILSGDAMSQH